MIKIRNPKHETRNKHESSKYEFSKQESIESSNINFGFVSDFDIRISDFLFYRRGEKKR